MTGILDIYGSQNNYLAPEQRQVACLQVGTVQERVIPALSPAATHSSNEFIAENKLRVFALPCQRYLWALGVCYS